MGVICGGAIVVGHTRTTRLTVVDPRRTKMLQINNEKVQIASGFFHELRTY